MVEKTKHYSDIKLIWLTIVLFFFVQIILNYCYPFTSDDLYYLHAVKLESISEIWNYALNWGNGRVLGNFLGFFLVRHTFINTIFKATCITGIYMLLLSLTKTKEWWVALFCGILVMFPSARIYAQVYVWTVAFADYVVPVLLFLFGLLIVQRNWIEETGRVRSIVAGTIVMVSSFISQLFIEHCTLFFAIVSCSLLVYSVVAKKKRIGIVISMVLGHAIGAICMMVIPQVYNRDYGNVSGYRSYAGSLISLIERNVKCAGRYTIGCVSLWCIFCAIMIWLLYNNKSGENNRIICSKNRRLLIYLYFLMFMTSIACSFDLYEIIKPSLEWFYAILFVLEVAVFVGSIYLLWQKGEFRPVAIILVCAVVAIGPLLVIQRSAPRLFYLAYILIVWAIVYFLNIISDELTAYKGKFRIGGTCAMLALSMVVLVMAGDWKYSADMRYTYIKRLVTEQGETLREIDLPKLPHDKFLQADADSNYWGYVLKDYLKLDKDADLNVEIRWNDWYSWLNVKE